MPKQEVVDADTVIGALLAPKSRVPGYSVSLEGFRAIHSRISGTFQDSTVHIVLNGDWALAQFASRPEVRIRIIPNGLAKKQNSLLQRNKRYLEEADFSFASSDAKFYGQREFITVWKFASEELQTGLRTKSALIALSILFFFAIASTSSQPGEILAAANDLLIAITTIFFTIFILFTIAQSHPMENVETFRAGLQHRFMRIDRLMAKWVILILVLACINRVLAAYLPHTTSNDTLIGSLDWLGMVVVIGTAINAAMMLVALLSIADYYFERQRYQVETINSRQILDEVATRKTTQHTKGDEQTEPP